MDRDYVSAAIAAVFCLCAFAPSASASSMPPAGYAKPDFVASDGCLYLKAQVGDWQIWVQQLDEKKRPVCGLTPTETGSEERLPMIRTRSNT